jgi:hypothetical protein
MRFVLALGWKLKLLQTFELLALSYSAAYLVWYSAISSLSSLTFVVVLGAGAGIILGFSLLIGASCFGRKVDAAESRFFSAIAKVFRRDDNEA